MKSFKIVLAFVLLFSCLNSIHAQSVTVSDEMKDLKSMVGKMNPLCPLNDGKSTIVGFVFEEDVLALAVLKEINDYDTLIADNSAHALKEKEIEKILTDKNLLNLSAKCFLAKTDYVVILRNSLNKSQYKSVKITVDELRRIFVTIFTESQKK